MSRQQFSRRSHAEIYNLYRPDIPQELAEKIISYCKEKFRGPLDQAVDIGCGSGQSTAILSPYFKRVVGIDVSKAQIDVARNSRPASNVTFTVGPAETLPFDNSSVQVVTACASLHWFQKDKFFTEIRRILAPNGVLACYTYHSIKPLMEDPISTEKIENLFTEKYQELYPYFLEGAFSSLNKYKDVCFPFEELVRPPDVRQEFGGRVSDIIGYIETLSGFQNMKTAEPEHAEEYMADFSERLRRILQLDDSEDKILPLFRDFYIVLCRKT